MGICQSTRPKCLQWLQKFQDCKSGAFGFFLLFSQKCWLETVPRSGSFGCRIDLVVNRYLKSEPLWFLSIVFVLQVRYFVDVAAKYKCPVHRSVRPIVWNFILDELNFHFFEFVSQFI